MSHTIPSLSRFRLLALPDTPQMERRVKDFLVFNRRWPDFIQEFKDDMLTGSYKLGVSYSQWSDRLFVTDGEGLPEITFEGDPISVLIVYGPYVLRNNNVQFQGIAGFFRLKNSTTSGSESDLQDLWTGIENLESSKVSKQTLDESIASVNSKFINYPTKSDVDTQVSNISLTPGPRGVPGPSAYNEWLLEGNTGSFEEFLQTIKGPRGEDGTGVTILGSFATVEELPATGQAGDSYLVNGDLYVWSETTLSWTNVGTIQGPQGDLGLKGDSAYQIAVAEGFQGTKNEWLLSLEGSPGTTLHSELTDSDSGDWHPQYALTDGSRGNFSLQDHAHSTSPHKDYLTFFESDLLTVVNGLGRNPMLENGTLVGIYAVVADAPSGSDIHFDVLLNDVIVYSGVIPDGTTHISNYELSVPLAESDVFSINITQVGSTFAGSNLTIILQYESLDSNLAVNPINPFNEFQFSYDGTIYPNIGLHRWYPWDNITVNAIRVSLGAAPTGSGININLNVNGVAQASVTVLDSSNTALLSGLSIEMTPSDYLTWDITSVGSNTPGAYLTGQVRYS